MGFSISWIGVRGLDRETILERLELVDTGEADDENQAYLSWAQLPDGWTIIFSNGTDYAEAKLATLSMGGVAVGCEVEEHVMYCRARGYREGAELWSITHDPENGIYDLTAKGDLPAAFPPIKARFIADQDREGGDEADVDMIFEIPTETAKAVCGYKHDEIMDAAFTTLRSLHRQAPKTGGFLKKLFGGFART